jgi:hypothetical protein
MRQPDRSSFITTARGRGRAVEEEGSWIKQRAQVQVPRLLRWGHGSKPICRLPDGADARALTVLSREQPSAGRSLAGKLPSLRRRRCSRGQRWLCVLFACVRRRARWDGRHVRGAWSRCQTQQHWRSVACRRRAGGKSGGKRARQARPEWPEQRACTAPC